MYSTNNVTRVGIVIPSYKEAENIALLIRALRAVVSDAEIIVVDDSPDRATVDAVESMHDPLATIRHRSQKGGRGSAVLDGLRHLLARDRDVIVEIDADFSHDPRELPSLLAALEDRKADLVIGSRYLPASRIERWPLSRRFFSKGANLLAASLLRVPIHDYTNGYRVYSRTAATVIDRTCGKLGKGFIPLSEILVNLHYRGLRVVEVPTVFVNRTRGESALTTGEITNALVGLFRIFALKRHLLRARAEGTLS